MKKFTKCLAVLSSVVMAFSAGIIQVSAGLESKIYDTEYTDENGATSVLRVQEDVYYDGIVVQMPDGSKPTEEEIGISCPILKFPESRYGVISDQGKGNDNWGYEEDVAAEENLYKLYVYNIMTEDEAMEFAKKLVIRGIAEKASVLYCRYITTGTIEPDSLQRNNILLNFKNEKYAEDFSFDKYPEIQKILRYTEYDSSCDSDVVTVYGGYDTSEYNNAGTKEIYNDVKTLNELLPLLYYEIESVEILFEYQTTADEYIALYFIEPKWGDATNDNVINLYDVIEISKYIMNISDMDEDTVLLADINRDGKTDIYDAIEVAKCIMEK